jgi:hypothetical protein
MSSVFERFLTRVITKQSPGTAAPGLHAVPSDNRVLWLVAKDI